MSTRLGLTEAVDRFRDNEQRVDGFVNHAPDVLGYTSTEGVDVPSIQTLMRDLNSNAVQTTAVQARDAAVAAAARAEAASVLEYTTKTDANAALAGLAEGQKILVSVDESFYPPQSRVEYVVVSGSFAEQRVVASGAGLEASRARMALPQSAFAPRFDFAAPVAVQTDVSLVQAQVLAIAATGTGPFEVAAGDTATNAQCQSTVSNPTARYTATVNGDGSYTITSTLAALRSIGVRSVTAVQANQRLTVEGTFATVVAGNGLQIGFDSGNTPGTYQFWTTGNVFFTWRENGAIVAYQNRTDGSVVDDPAAGYTFALRSGANTPFVAGDVLKMQFISNTTMTGGMLTLSKNGILAATYAVSGAIFGNYCGAMRMFNDVATINFIEYRIPFEIPLPTSLAYDVGSVLARIPLPAGTQGSRSALTADAERLRVLPPGFDYLPIRPIEVRGFGNVVVDMSLRQAWMLRHGATIATQAVAFVEATGSDSSAILGDPANPFLTIQAALNSAARLVVVGAGTFNPFSLRADQASGAGPKMVVAKVRGAAKIAVLGGDDIASATWTQTSGQSNVWQTTLATTQKVDKVLIKDSLDAHGFPSRLRLRFSVEDLQSAGRGWYFDDAADTLYIALSGASVEAQKSRLRALYLDSANNARIFAFGAKLFIGGLYLENVQCRALHTGGVAAEIWSEGNIRFMCPGNGILVEGGSGYSSNDRNHATQADTYNYNTAAGGLIAYGVESNCYTTDPGDTMTFGATVAGGAARVPNINASSSHQGYCARFAHNSEGAYGPEIADISSETFAESATWMVGCVQGPSDTRGQNIGVGIYGTSTAANRRKAWLDTCIAEGQVFADLNIEQNAQVNVFNSLFPNRQTLDASGAASYAPDAP